MPVEYVERAYAAVAPLLAAERARAEELEHLFDLQRTRMVAATERWRAEAPAERSLTLPDLGRLLEWLMAQSDAERAAREAAERTLESVSRNAVALIGSRYCERHQAWVESATFDAFMAQINADGCERCNADAARSAVVKGDKGC